MAEPLGQYFRRAREARGWTLEQTAARTRILPEYLQAVEEDNYERLPEEVFAKGFVRSYARLLGLNESEILQKFHETGGQFYAKRAEREQLRVQIREEEQRKKTNQLIVAAMIGVALVALLLVTGHDRDGGKPAADTMRESAPGPRNPLPVSPSEKGESTPSSRSELPARTDPATPSAPNESVSRVPHELQGAATAPPTPTEIDPHPATELPLEGSASERKKLVLEVEAIERAWIMVQVDENSAQDVLLFPGERVRWSAADKLTLTLGNAGGVRILMNGKPQGPYGTSGKVVKDLVFTR